MEASRKYILDVLSDPTAQGLSIPEAPCWPQRLRDGERPMEGAGAHSRVDKRRRREGEHGGLLGCGVGRFFMPLFTRVRGI
jgi:hypothetical protein